MSWSGKRVAVAGLGRSGIAVAKAAKQLGAQVVAFDERPSDNPSVITATDDLSVSGVEVVSNWHGRLDPDEFDTLVVSPGFAITHPSIHDMGGREVMGEVEFAYLAANDPVIAITGTNGKSTTTVLTWLLLKAAGVDAILCGNIAGSGYPEMTVTEAAMQGGEVLVAEISSFQLETVKNFRPFVATVTNIAPDHLDRHASYEEYVNCKLRLFDRMSGGDTIVIDKDAPGTPLDRINDNCRNVWLSSTGTNSTNGHTARVGTTLFFSGHQIDATSLKVIGEHNVANAMVAWELACSFVGEPTQDQADAMLSALLSFEGLKNRMEVVAEKGGVSVINNSVCTNPEAVISSSQGLAGKQHLLIGGKRKNLNFEEVGQYLRGTDHQAYLFGPDTAELNSQLGGLGQEFVSMGDAFEAAVQAAGNGESVILMPGCASAAPYPSFRERGEHFVEMAERWLLS